MKKVLSVLLAVFLLLGAAPMFTNAADGMSGLIPTESGREPDVMEDAPNFSLQNYSKWSSKLTSFLYENERGGVTRVQCNYYFDHINEHAVLVEEYDAEYNLQAYQKLKFELPLWGGFFSGENYNFLIFGQENKSEKDNAEVIRVVRYDKGWNRIDHASVYGANTTVPFEAGSVRCTENNGYLFIHTAHEMYKSSDGINHQANMTISVDEGQMKVVMTRHGIGGAGYVSHSFNQFILTNETGELVTLDHGDGHPRCLYLQRFSASKAAEGLLEIEYSGEHTFSILRFPGATGENYTGASVSSLAETRNGYMVSYAYDGDGMEVLNLWDRDAYYCYIDKATFKGTPVKLTNTKSASAPIVASMGLDGGYIMWNEVEDNQSNHLTDTMYYAKYTSDGQIGEIKQAKARLSDCAPIYHDGKLVWFTNYYNLIPYPPFGYIQEPVLAFYSLDADGNLTEERVYIPDWEDDPNPDETPSPSPSPSSSPSPSPSVSPSPSPITDPTPTTGPTPTTDPTPTPKPSFTDVKSTDYFADAVKWAVENSITAGKGNNLFKPNDKCTRGEIVTFLWRSAGSPEPEAAANSFSDVKEKDYYYKAVLWAVENDITAGKGVGTFKPGDKCTRAEAMTFMWRASGEPAPNGSGSFKDVLSGSFYEKAVGWAVEKGITAGKGTGTFKPNDKCSRAEIVSFLYRGKDL